MTAQSRMGMYFDHTGISPQQHQISEAQRRPTGMIVVKTNRLAVRRTSTEHCGRDFDKRGLVIRVGAKETKRASTVSIGVLVSVFATADNIRTSAPTQTPTDVLEYFSVSPSAISDSSRTTIKFAEPISSSVSHTALARPSNSLIHADRLTMSHKRSSPSTSGSGVS